MKGLQFNIMVIAISTFLAVVVVWLVLSGPTLSGLLKNLSIWVLGSNPLA